MRDPAPEAGEQQEVGDLEATGEERGGRSWNRVSIGTIATSDEDGEGADLWSDAGSRRPATTPDGDEADGQASA